MRTSILASVLLFALLGCGRDSRFPVVVSSPPVTGAAIAGKLFSGTLPVAGAHVYLFAAATTGYGSASVPLLTSSSTGYSDSIGTYVLTAQDGSFTLPGYYSCTTATQIYIYAQGGNSGLGENSAAVALAALGNCPALGVTVPASVVNEVTTVAAVVALSGFATDALHIASNGTDLARTGLANAFVNASHLAPLGTALAAATLPSGNATVPQQTVNSLANVLSSCTHSTGPGSSSCAALFSSAKTGTAMVVDTATAMLNIARSPATNVPTLFALQASSPPFTPDLSAAPNDWSLGIVFTGGGINAPGGMALDSAGDLWVVNYFGNSITEISGAGTFLSGTGGYPANLYAAAPIAIDLVGNVWIGNYSGYLGEPGSIVELSSSGAVLSGANGFTAGGSLRAPGGLAIDAANHVWVSNTYANTLTELSDTGQVLSPSSGFTGGGLTYPGELTIDANQNIWVTNESFGISKFNNSGSALSGVNGFTASGFYGGNAVAVDSQANIWITNSGGYAQVAKMSQAGVVLSGPGYSGGGIGIGNGLNYSGGTFIALDGANHVWVPLTQRNSVAELASDGTVLSGATGYAGGIALAPVTIAIDASGDVWVSNNIKVQKTSIYQITEIIGVATPTITPLVAGVANNLIASRP